MTSEKKDIWSPRKTFGHGWGLPVVWQGWVALAVYFALLGGGILLLAPDRRPLFYVFLAVITVAFVMLVRWKGEEQ